MLDAKIKHLKQTGKENVQHKPPLEQEDLAKLKTSGVFNLNHPLSLLRCVWFHIVLFWCRRGREGQRSLTVNSFAFEVDSLGERYVRLTHDEPSKNHPGGISDVSSHEKEARMYATDQPIDGYKALSYYLTKVNPNCPALFQYPVAKNWKSTNPVWYENRPLGVNKLAKMMADISKTAGLSRIYTNHSARATAITCSLVECWYSKPPYYGNLWPPKWTKSCSLQRTSILVTASQLQQCVISLSHLWPSFRFSRYGDSAWPIDFCGRVVSIVNKYPVTKSLHGRQHV